MDIESLLKTLLHGNQLKRTVRTGWVQRGVPNPESVAAHSYGVAFIALVLAGRVDGPIDLGRLLAMAVLHDLPEGVTTDIPTPAWRHLPPGSKGVVERQVMEMIMAGWDVTGGLMALWDELHALETAEARLVHDADKLDMFLQALVYQEQTGNQKLQEFWDAPIHFYFDLSQNLHHELRRQRDGL